jgi:GAF domain/Sel1 repeat
MHLSSSTQELEAGPNRDGVHGNVMSHSPVLDPNRDYDSKLSEILAMPKITGASVALAFGDQLECIRSFGDSAPPIGTRCYAGVGLTGACFAAGKIQLCNNTENDSRADLEACADLDVGSVLVVPIMRGSIPAGVLDVLSSKSNAFDWRTIRRIKRIARVFEAFTLDSNVDSRDRHEVFEKTATAPVPSLHSEFELQEMLHSAWLIQKQRAPSAIASDVKDSGMIVDTHPDCEQRHSADPVLHPVTELPTQRYIDPPTFGMRKEAAPILVTLEEKSADKGRRRRLVAFGITFVVLFAGFVELRTHIASSRKVESDWLSSPASLRKYPNKADKAEMQSVIPSQNERHIQRSALSPGTALPQSSAGAVAKSDDALKNRNADASWNLGLSYLNGDGVPQDERRAAGLLKRAANLGNPRAQAALSDLYLKGIGVQRDYVRAYTWASIAAGQLGGEDERLAAMAQRMSKAELEDANRRVQTWFARKGAVLRQ